MDSRAESTASNTPPKLEAKRVEAAIERIRQADLTATTIADLHEMLTPAFIGYQVLARRFDPGLKLFRGRITSKPSHISELLYPQPEKVSSLSRVNEVGESILYASTSREAPFFELGAAPGDTLVVARWRTTRPLLCNIVGYTQEAFESLGSKRQCPAVVVVPDDDLVKINSRVAHFLAEAFTQVIPANESHRYKLTIAVARHMFSAEMFDGLLYPSVAMWANGDNIAVKPAFADVGLALEKIEFVAVSAVAEKRLEINVLDTAISATSAGGIEWRGRGDQWVLRNIGETLRLEVENGKWVARDESGRVVEPT